MLLPEQQRAPEAPANKEKDYLSESKPSQIIATTTARTTKSLTLDQNQQYCKLKLYYIFY